MNDKVKGALWGGVVGDSAGMCAEFLPRGSFPPITGYRSGGPFNLEKGAFTDDTSMALCLADSIATVGWDLKDQLKRYVDWYENGKYSVNGKCFDIGCTTRHALNEFIRTGEVNADLDENASGNGCIMRLSAVPAYYRYLFPHYLPELMVKAEESSATTHGSEQCKSSCRYMTAIICAFIHGDYTKDEVLSTNWRILKEIENLKPLHPLVKTIANGSFKTKTLEEIDSSGWVIATLEAAIYSFYHSNSFEEAVFRSCNMGLDADTVGCVTGQIAGAYYGFDAIPKELIEGLSRKDMLEEYFGKLYKGN